MPSNIKLGAKDVALASVCTALYAVLGFVKISPIIGLEGQAVTAAAVMAPIIGILIGPYLGVISTSLGGTIGFFLGSLAYPSLVSGLAASFCAGLIREGKRFWSALTYLFLLLAFVFYPSGGPAWLFPWMPWFQIVGLVIVASPLQWVAGKSLDSEHNPRLLLSLFLACLVSTLAGQIAGSLVFEIPMDITTLTVTWVRATFLYPVERIIIAVAATLIGAASVKALKRAHLFSQLRIHSEVPATKKVPGR